MAQRDIVRGIANDANLRRRELTVDAMVIAIAAFDVSVALWVKIFDEGLWSLYIGSTSVEPAKISDAYRLLYACLSKIPDPWVSLSEVKLIQASNPIAKDAITARDRQPARLPVRN